AIALGSGLWWWRSRQSNTSVSPIESAIDKTAVDEILKATQAVLDRIATEAPATDISHQGKEKLFQQTNLSNPSVNS
ncbi:MAG: hypothetical protein RI580_14850, partial [Halothece sp. Uz-M2-17]|nr:hypothetical protein [Halothece sp. Uz-M2-17]